MGHPGAGFSIRKLVMNNAWLISPPQRVMAELEECVEEVVWGSQVFSRRWGADARDLIGRTPEW